ncbi:MAG: CBS domain-containing protein [Ignavibacteria bacterium]|nr:CBS domain-containing protein [Ignavibacteria bacterium]MBT8381100.1 CBS domain-containing protein [Ignavibacteria bacterium]MBT8392136.1 CBS domain-containing protein [Ignavibacteria bacterium]NNJ53536.1 magnesium transporter [Ignavibacteriaceae bacterium]NNL20463.1 magnesium transporter [Ignavibacteriaceae bacterium]
MNNNKVLLEQFILDHSGDAARLLEQLDTKQLTQFLISLPDDLSVILIQEMEIYTSLKCLEELEIEKSVVIVESLPIIIASSFLRRMKKNKKELILEKMDQKISKTLSQMLYHIQNTAGALMDPQVSIVNESLNVKEVLEKVKRSKQQFLQYIYVVDQDGKLLGIVKLEELIVADPKEQITSMMSKEFPRLYAEVEAQRILNHQGWLEYNALPVIDRSGIFLGALNQTEIRKIEVDKVRKVPKHAVQAINSLGELYRIGLSGLLSSTIASNKETD